VVHAGRASVVEQEFDRPERGVTMEANRRRGEPRLAWPGDGGLFLLLLGLAASQEMTGESSIIS
jgi:hypothetical protein